MRESSTALKRTNCGVPVLLALVAWLSGPATAPAQGPRRYELADLKALERAFVELADEVRPSVVAIQTYLARDPSTPEGRLIRIRVNKGSGFIIDPNGYIVTNRHVLEDANMFTAVLHDALARDATICETDPRTDLAVLKIDADGLKPVRFGDLADVKVNQWTFACGSPFGLAGDRGNPSVTWGVVSALGRDMTSRFGVDSRVHYYGNLIETSAAINPGSSGGPLFNIDRQVIGVVTAIATDSGVNEGVGFAIPIDQNTRRVLDLLKAGHEVHYGFLGVTVENVEPPRSRHVADALARRGARIRVIDPANGPAAKAGLIAGDIVLEVDGVPVKDTDHLVRLVGFSPVGKAVEITYLRRRVKRKTTVTLGDRYEVLGLVGPN